MLGRHCFDMALSVRLTNLDVDLGTPVQDMLRLISPNELSRLAIDLLTARQLISIFVTFRAVFDHVQVFP